VSVSRIPVLPEVFHGGEKRLQRETRTIVDSLLLVQTFLGVGEPSRLGNSGAPTHLLA
jgi:hypothetical protein